MKNTIIWILVGAVCLVVGFFGTLYFLPSEEPAISEPLNNQGTILSPTPFSLQPPAQSLRATLTQKSGSVLHKTRDTNAFAEATPSGTILIGESIATSENGKATIGIPSLATISMENDTELVFANMYKENTVLQQKSGKILYTITSVLPVSIRALHTLISSNQSVFLVSVIDSDIAVTSQKGGVKIAFVDNENTTHVYTIPEGKRANIDDANRTISIVLPR